MHPSTARRVPAYWLAVLPLLITLSAPAFPQSTSGRILGRIADPTGAVLSGVRITLVNDATGASRNAQSNESGDYNFVEVVPGSYRVEFELTGFKKNVQTSK
jgi:Carboxypeptidase regulatory-like domain